MYICIHTYISIYIYIQRERERERDEEIKLKFCVRIKRHRGVLTANDAKFFMYRLDR